jgi:oligoendopeptidase F
MPGTVRSRTEIPAEFTWDIASVYAGDEAWETAFSQIEQSLPGLERFQGHLGDNPSTLADWLKASEAIAIELGKIFLYANSQHNVDTSDPTATAQYDRASGLAARAAAATAFDEPEILALGIDTLRAWMAREPRLAIYGHYFDSLESRREHVRSAEIEEVLGLVRDPFSTASTTHRVLTDTDLTFQPAVSATGETIEIAQGNINALVTDADRTVRRTAWENYADAHLALKNTFANCLTAGVKQDVFTMRVRRYNSSVEASLRPNHIPVDVFHNLIETYRRNLPTWRRYWRVRRQALGYDALHVYDVKAPLTIRPLDVPYSKAVDWICAGMEPLGEEYGSVMRRGLMQERWVDVYPNRGKRSGAYSSGAYRTHPFILMSHNDDIFGLSTLAHELGHAMHSHFTRTTQPFVYGRYSLFVAEVASNFNQALVRAHLLKTNDDRDFQITVIEEAMSNFHRYFFIMPTLARFELEIHERVERGEALNAGILIGLMTDLFREGYSGEVDVDAERVGITWAEFPIHMYYNFYVYQYATGIAAAQALAQQVLSEGPPAAERYLAFLKSGGSLYPLDALRLAGVDMTSPEPIDRAFGIMAGLVDRLDELTRTRAPTIA